jgi:flavin reductase (DIM6/NTAB) family NADH-FMN oxidoreductase RutF
MNVNVIDSATFREACSRFPTGVTVTTVSGEGGTPYGITVSSFTSVSLAPPLVLVCIDQKSRLVPYCSTGKCFGVNVLSAEQRDLSIQFAGQWSNRFTNVRWGRGRTGVPLLADVLAAFECEITKTIPAGDHLIIIGRVLQAGCTSRPALLYANRSYATPVLLQTA